jgi:hypothetical protein
MNNFLFSTNEKAQQIADRQQDFELKQPNSLKTSKDLYIKNFFAVNDVETSMRHGQKFRRLGLRGVSNTISGTEYLIGITALAVAPTVGLPDAKIVGPGKSYIVKDEVGGAATTTITVRSEAERNIDGSATSTITTNYGAKSYYSDGSNWFTY